MPRQSRRIACVIGALIGVLAARPAHAQGFPRATLFRVAIETAARRGDPQEWAVALAEHYDMVIAKALDDEVIGLQKAAPYLQAIKARYPAKVVLDHFLFTGRNPASTQPAVFPGHWLLLNGTTLAADLSRADTVLQVTDSSVLREGEAVQIMALNAAGKPDYEKVEQVRVVSVASGRATVERGAFGSTPLEFKARETRVAAHAWVTWSNEVWKYNFCLDGPRDGEGRRLIEALAGTLTGYLGPGGILAGLDGYQFDVAQFYPSSQDQGTRRVDCDNDGRADGGLINGVNSFGLGAVTFTRTLRGLVGNEILLVSEATGPRSDRDIAYANGIENESFPDLHEWDLFSAAYQRYQYWLQAARQPRLSYLQLKESTEAFTRCPDRDRGTNWKYRLALAAALMGNGYFAYIPFNPEDEPDCFFTDPVTRYIYGELDEFKAGRAEQWNYLGLPSGEPRRLDASSASPGLISNGDFEQDVRGATLALVGASQATLARDASQAGKGAASLHVAITRLDPDPADNKVRVEFPSFAVQKGRPYTLRLRVRADPKYGAVDPAFAEVPRRVAVLFRAGTSRVTQDVTADRTWREYSLTFVAPDNDAAATVAFVLGVEAGDVWLDDLRLSQGSGDVFVRRFEKGVVLLNASTQPVRFDLAALFPGLTLRRISGTQDPAVNSGALAGSAVTVPERDALILVPAD
ncbi:MAG: hypothetical protein HY824_16275 [Acidobacteria bacterium]|nr:hypothetical protein [Acidobacteriota bacterium]